MPTAAAATSLVIILAAQRFLKNYFAFSLPSAMSGFLLFLLRDDPRTLVGGRGKRRFAGWQSASIPPAWYSSAARTHVVEGAPSQ